jgi:hypothetical protein
VPCSRVEQFPRFGVATQELHTVVACVEKTRLLLWAEPASHVQNLLHILPALTLLLATPRQVVMLSNVFQGTSECQALNRHERCGQVYLLIVLYRTIFAQLGKPI